MTPIDKSCWSLLASLAIASIMSCGQVVAFKATPTAAGPRPWPDTVGTLPSHVTAGQTAVYAPGGGQETASRMPPARVATP
jgi:hypothetical protein